MGPFGGLTIDDIACRRFENQAVDWLWWQDRWCGTQQFFLPDICRRSRKDIIEAHHSLCLRDAPIIGFRSFVETITYSPEGVWFDDWSEAGMPLLSAIRAIACRDLTAESFHFIAHPNLSLALFLGLLK